MTQKRIVDEFREELPEDELRGIVKSRDAAHNGAFIDPRKYNRKPHALLFTSYQLWSKVRQDHNRLY